MVEKKTVRGILRTECTTMMVCVRARKNLRVAFDQEFLPVLSAYHLLERLYMLESSCKDHGGQDCMMMRSRSQVWILVAQRLAKGIKGHCFTCKYLTKRCAEQLMAPCWTTRWARLHLFSPQLWSCSGHSLFRIRTTRGKQERHCLCLHCHIPEARGDDQVLLHGLLPDGPEKVHNHPQSPEEVPVRSGRVAGNRIQAAGYVGLVQSGCTAQPRGATYRLVPTGGECYNEQAERVIGLMKLCLA